MENNMKSVTLSFDNAANRDQFIKAINNLATNDTQFGKMMAKAIKTARFDAEIRQDDERVCSLWVSGQKIMEGQFADIENKFGMECDAHSASVAIKEMRNGTWVDIRKRNIQPR
jgi:hypothetical protein